MDYEKLRDPQTAKELPIEFRKEFELLPGCAT